MHVSSAAAWTDAGVEARSLGRDGLSLALIDARNRGLRWLTAFEQASLLMGDAMPGPNPLFLLGRVGWLQEWWIVRNLQRLRGEAMSHNGLRLPGTSALHDSWFGHDARALIQEPSPPDAAMLRGYLQTTLEQTLDLLLSSPQDEAALYVFRCALQLEDRLAEQLAVAAQVLGMLPGEAAAPLGPAPSRAPREPLWMPAQRFQLGSTLGRGWTPANERWAHDEAVPEFEIDAQALSWERYVEFAEDGGYDRPELWRPESWQWVQEQGRRAPRFVEQLRGGALITRFGRLQKASATQAVSHVSWHEADAWCRWAGRRLPTELEWELAACSGKARGFAWGDVWEWVGGTARSWPGGSQVVQTTPQRRVLRGASSWTAPRAVHARQRRFVAGQRDELFCGFRSCSM